MPAKTVESTPSPQSSDTPLSTGQIAQVVARVLDQSKFIDVHTHLFMPSLGSLGLWGIDELITYHYLEAELFRFSGITPDRYWALSKREQADLIWKTLFIENTPLSEATRGVIAVLNAFHLNTQAKDLREAREFFERQSIDEHISHVFELGGITEAVMTNDPLDPAESNIWKQGVAKDSRFHPVLRLDSIVNKWDAHWKDLKEQGYAVDADLTGSSIDEVKRFLFDWCARMQPVYMACSLPDTFAYPASNLRAKLLGEAVLAVGREFDIPLSLMIGVRYQVNPAIRLAGDASGKADLRSLEHLCAAFPQNRFLVSVLSRENQHELCVYARKFGNLLPFGCWWFLNNPSIVEEITRERIEMLGTSFIPQHSDARVLEQIIYKWHNTRRTLSPILAKSYELLSEDGRPVTEAEIKRDVELLFRTNFERWVNLKSRDERQTIA